MKNLFLEVMAYWKKQATELKLLTYALFYAAKDPRLPWIVKLLAMAIVAYAFSPIDLIPDFIPVLGALDDLLIIPLGVTLIMKMIPRQVMEESKLKAIEHLQDGKPTVWYMAVVIVGVWISAAGVVLYWLSKIAGWG